MSYHFYNIRPRYNKPEDEIEKLSRNVYHFYNIRPRRNKPEDEIEKISRNVVSFLQY